ncbi:MAG TPA: hypothetical protein VFU22_00190 [Roseiflexaceae bacterium]|nr:hypothetical protein [Roseiflexaceae bacterium]
MEPTDEHKTLDPAAAIGDAAYPLTGAATDYDGLLDLIGDARFVLIGEASHGTHEFYRQRALITRRLIVERDFLQLLRDGGEIAEQLRAERLGRAIGVIYYFHARLADQFDAVSTSTRRARSSCWSIPPIGSAVSCPKRSHRAVARARQCSALAERRLR